MEVGVSLLQSPSEKLHLKRPGVWTSDGAGQAHAAQWGQAQIRPSVSIQCPDVTEHPGRAGRASLPPAQHYPERKETEERERERAPVELAGQLPSNKLL